MEVISSGREDMSPDSNAVAQARDGHVHFLDAVVEYFHPFSKLRDNLPPRVAEVALVVAEICFNDYADPTCTGLDLRGLCLSWEVAAPC
jgi:hypothetical protein